MAAGLRGLFRLNLGLTKTVFSKPNFLNVGIRFLYTEVDLGISAYESMRFMFRNQFMSIEDTFRNKMKEICEAEDGVVFTEDLKAMLHLAQPTEEDMKLVTDMLMKFVSVKREKEFSSYVFGSVIMRMFYYLNEPKTAMILFKNPNLVETFGYHSAIRTLMCLLYKHKMYEELKEVYETMIQVKGIEFALITSVIMFAGCMKQDTPEAAKYVLEQWKKHNTYREPPLRSTAIAAYLAIKHNNADEGFEMISVIRRDNAMTTRCLKVLALSRLRKFLSVIPILKYSLEQEIMNPQKHSFFGDVLYELEENLQSETGPEKEHILNLIDKLRRQQRIETTRTFEEFLLRPFVLLKDKRVQSPNRLLPRSERGERREGLKSYL